MGSKVMGKENFAHVNFNAEMTQIHQETPHGSQGVIPKFCFGVEMGTLL